MIVTGTREVLAEKAAAILHEETRKILDRKEFAVLAVPGGRSVAAIYEIFRDSALDWERVHIFLLDDRLVAADHDDSNYKLVANHLGEQITASSLHRFPYDADNPQQSVADYKKELELYGGRLDIVLASAGEDGHIASLFPGHPALDVDESGFVLLYDSPKPPPARMSVSVPLLQQAEVGVVLFMGESKGEAFVQFQGETVAVSQCPAKLIATLPHYYVLTDQEVGGL